MYGEHPDGGRTKIDSHDVEFIENDFPKLGNTVKNLDLHELVKDEELITSSSEWGELISNPMVAEYDVWGRDPSGSTQPSGSNVSINT